MAFQFGMADMMFGGELLGCLQNVSVDFSFSTSVLYCGSGIFPSDVRTHTGTVSGSAEFADLTAVGLQRLLGGTVTGTELELTNTSRPSAFEMVISLTTDGISFVVTFKRVRSTKFSMQFVRDNHLIPNFDFSCEADENGTICVLDVGDVS